MDEVRADLVAQEKSALVDMLMERASDDEHLRQRLLLNAAKKRSKSVGLAAYRRAIDEAVDTGEFVDYRGAYGDE